MRTGRQDRVFYGWFIVAVSSLCWFSADALGWYTFGRPVSFAGSKRAVRFRCGGLTQSLLGGVGTSGFRQILRGPSSDSPYRLAALTIGLDHTRS
jgi:hypothetical protein